MQNVWIKEILGDVPSVDCGLLRPQIAELYIQYRETCNRFLTLPDSPSKLNDFTSMNGLLKATLLKYST